MLVPASLGSGPVPVAELDSTRLVMYTWGKGPVDPAPLFFISFPDCLPCLKPSLLAAETESALWNSGRNKRLELFSFKQEQWIMRDFVPESSLKTAF